MNSCKIVKKISLAFTLAETLITLAIIGVVAALTIPSMVSKYQKRVYVTGLQKNYAVLTEAFKAAQIENGDATGWDWTDTEKITDILSKYLKVEKKYPPNSDLYKAMCYEEGGYTHKENSFNPQYMWLSQIWQISSPFISNKTASMKLINGACIGVNPLDSAYASYREIFLDINGSNKKPNVAGKDLFFFYINDKNELKPFGDTWSNEDLGVEIPLDESSTNTKGNACTVKNGNGGGVCAEKIIREGWRITYF